MHCLFLCVTHNCKEKSIQEDGSRTLASVNWGPGCLNTQGWWQRLSPLAVSGWIAVSTKVLKISWFMTLLCYYKNAMNLLSPQKLEFRSFKSVFLGHGHSYFGSTTNCLILLRWMLSDLTIKSKLLLWKLSLMNLWPGSTTHHKGISVNTDTHSLHCLCCVHEELESERKKKSSESCDATKPNQ